MTAKPEGPYRIFVQISGNYFSRGYMSFDEIMKMQDEYAVDRWVMYTNKEPMLMMRLSTFQRMFQ